MSDKRQTEGLGNGVFDAGKTVCLPTVIFGLKTGGIVDGRNGDIIQEKTSAVNSLVSQVFKAYGNLLAANWERSTDSWSQPLLCPVYAQAIRTTIGIVVRARGSGQEAPVLAVAGGLQIYIIVILFTSYHIQ